VRRGAAYAVATGGGPAGLELGDALDLDQAHAARADRLAELGLVAEDRDLDVAVLGGVDQHRALGRGDLAAVDREGDHADRRPRHQAPAAVGSTSAGSSIGYGPGRRPRVHRAVTRARAC